jgi:hypothetical protein
MFYVYGYLDDRDEIYYVGKGKGRRYKHPHHHLVNVPFDEDKIIFFEKNITEEQSINLERKLIKFYGRRGIDGGGCLINRTKGGNGGFSGKMSEETKKKIGESGRGRVVSEEVRKRISNTLKGKKHSSERIKNIRKGMGCETYKFISPEGEIFEVDNMTQFCYDRNLQQSCMSNIWNNKYKAHKGWKKF